MNRNIGLLWIAGVVALGCSAATSAPVPVTVPAASVSHGPGPVAARKPRRDPTADEVAFVAHTQDGPVVIVEHTLQDGWIAGPPELVTEADAGVLEVRRALAVERLPSTTKAWRGRRVVLYAHDRVICSASVEGLEIIGLADQPGMDWSGKPNGGPPASATTIAQEAWEFSAGYVVARLRVENGGNCSKATWARDASLPPARFATPEAADPKLAGRALEAFRTLPAWAENQRAYAEEQDRRRTSGFGADPEARWDHHASVDVVQVPNGTARVVVRARVGEICGFGAELMAVYALASEDLRLLHAGPVVAFHDVFDANGDGRLEALGESEREAATVFSWSDDGSLEPLRSFLIPYAGCPC